MSKHSSTPWVLCHHLRSPEHDASCPCGYRGGVWSGPDDTILFEMGQTPDFAHDNDKMLPEASREMQLADAAFIVRACNAHDDLVAALKAAFMYAPVGSDASALCMAAIAKAEESS